MTRPQQVETRKRPHNQYDMGPMMAHIRRALLIVSVAYALGISGIATAETSVARARTGVVVSIKPIHSLVAAIMQGVGTPRLIVRGSGSPHIYMLKPSDAKALEHAKLIFWVGARMEVFLHGPMEALGTSATIVALADADGLVRWQFREGSRGQDRDRDDVTVADHKRAAKHKHESAKSNIDMHLWLDPQNAKIMASEIVRTLAKVDPARATVYETNGRALKAKLNTLIQDLHRELDVVKGKPFVVFHDAFQYFEKRFGLDAVSAVTLSPDRQPGAAQITKIQRQLAILGATCVFAEPQFLPRLLNVVIEGTRANVAILDPLGAGLKDGPDLYFKLMRRNAKALKDCLAKSS